MTELSRASSSSSPPPQPKPQHTLSLSFHFTSQRERERVCDLRVTEIQRNKEQSQTQKFIRCKLINSSF
nr:hypothetical protein CFP56_46350 [Quercus suber]